MTKRISTPKHAITVRSYAELGEFVRAFAKGGINLLILVGPPGVAKTQTVKQALEGKDYNLVEGNASAFGLYQSLYEHRDELTVIDDIDALYSDKAAVRLLKCLCQTDAVKRLGWFSAAAGLTREGLPKEFETRSRVALIANDWKTLNANVEAVNDRGHLIRFEPTAEEVHRQVAKFFSDQVVFDWFGEHLHLIPSPSMRHYVRAAELHAAGLDWLKVLMGEALSEKTLAVARLKADPKLRTEADRVKAFVEAGHGSRATYFNHAKRLRPEKKRSEPMERIVLPNAKKKPRLRIVRKESA
jgi:hypothetical protein